MIYTLITIAASVYSTAYLIKKNIINPDNILETPCIIKEKISKYCKKNKKPSTAKNSNEEEK